MCRPRCLARFLIAVVFAQEAGMDLCCLWRYAMRELLEDWWEDLALLAALLAFVLYIVCRRLM